MKYVYIAVMQSCAMLQQMEHTVTKESWKVNAYRSNLAYTKSVATITMSSINLLKPSGNFTYQQV
jgi:hypothetical protein